MAQDHVLPRRLHFLSAELGENFSILDANTMIELFGQRIVQREGLGLWPVPPKPRNNLTLTRLQDDVNLSSRDLGFGLMRWSSHDLGFGSMCESMSGTMLPCTPLCGAFPFCCLGFGLKLEGLCAAPLGQSRPLCRLGFGLKDEGTVDVGSACVPFYDLTGRSVDAIIASGICLSAKQDVSLLPGTCRQLSLSLTLQGGLGSGPVTEVRKSSLDQDKGTPSTVLPQLQANILGEVPEWDWSTAPINPRLPWPRSEPQELSLQSMPLPPTLKFQITLPVIGKGKGTGLKPPEVNVPPRPFRGRDSSELSCQRRKWPKGGFKGGHSDRSPMGLMYVCLNEVQGWWLGSQMHPDRGDRIGW